LWRSRHLLGYFALHTIRWGYKATVLGWLWLVIRPMVPVVSSTLVFHKLAGVQSGEVPYFLFFLVGNSIWIMFEESLLWITRSLQINREVLTKFCLPRIILPATAVAPGLVGLLVDLGLISACSLYFVYASGKLYLTLGWETLLAVAAVALTIVLALGLGMFTSVIGAEHRDVRFILQYLMRFWFFLTPIVYPFSLVPEQWRWLAGINPMTMMVELYRWGLFGLRSELSIGQVATTLLILAVLFASGLWFFIKFEAASVDRLGPA